GAIDAVFASGSAPVEFVGLLNEPAATLAETLERIGGQNESAAAQAGHESMRQFLGLVLNPFAGTRPSQQPVSGFGTLWGAGYGSHMHIQGNPRGGTHSDINGGGGFAVGYDVSLATATVGAAFLYDHRDFSVAQDFGRGHDNGYNFSI